MTRKENEVNEGFPPGTVVQLKSGGPKMTTGRGEVEIQCFWADDAGGHCFAFPAASLQRADHTPDVEGQALRLCNELGYAHGLAQLSEAVTFAVAEHDRACMLYRELCKLAGEDEAADIDVQVLLAKVAEQRDKTGRAYNQLAELAGIYSNKPPEDLATQIRFRLVLSADQADALAGWRAGYFDHEPPEVAEALINILKLRLWGQEIKNPELRAVAAESTILRETAALLEALAPLPEEG